MSFLSPLEQHFFLTLLKIQLVSFLSPFERHVFVKLLKIQLVSFLSPFERHFFLKLLKIQPVSFLSLFEQHFFLTRLSSSVWSNDLTLLSLVGLHHLMTAYHSPHQKQAAQHIMTLPFMAGWNQCSPVLDSLFSRSTSNFSSGLEQFWVLVPVLCLLKSSLNSGSCS